MNGPDDVWLLRHLVKHREQLSDSTIATSMRRTNTLSTCIQFTSMRVRRANGVMLSI